MTRRVSIVMPCYNSEAFLPSALDSVLAQRFQDWELLLVDDDSSDDSKAIAAACAEKDARVRVLANDYEKGAAGARNTAIRHAQGRFIAFLDSDDRWHPCYLAERIAAMEEKGHAFSYAYYEKRDEDGRFLGLHRPRAPQVSYRELLTDCVIGCLTAIYDTRVVGKIYTPSIQKRNDFALWLQILKQVDSAHLYPKVVATYTVRKNSVSSKKLKLVRHNWAIYRRIEGFAVPTALWYFSLFMWKYLSRKIRERAELRRSRAVLGKERRMEENSL